jgi:hypothetical protein
MPPSKTLVAFTPEQKEKVPTLLAASVAYMMGRKFEEGDWSGVYCKAKGIPQQSWSNLNIDVMHDGLGVEHKMIRYKSNVDLAEACGQTFMHPSATRSIRIPPHDSTPDEAMRNIFVQYADLIKERTRKVKEASKSGQKPDMRTGWLLWQESLRQFLYFEERMIAPIPRNYKAEWHVTTSGGRKGSKNLWVYEKATGKKRHSITTEAGAKVQPYFDVPMPDDPNLCLLTVIGEIIGTDLVRTWITAATLRELKRYVKDTDTDMLSKLILAEVKDTGAKSAERAQSEQLATPILLHKDAYARLKAAYPSVNDDHSFQFLVAHLSKGNP